MALTLFHDWDSVCSFKVRMCLAEKGLAWESRRVNLLRFENLAPAYLALNPNGVVPTLVADGATIIESSVINEFLDEMFPDPPLMPDDPVLRARMRTWVKYQDDVIYFAQRPATFQLLVKKMLSGFAKEEIEALVDAHPQPERARHFLDWATGPVDLKVVEDARAKLDAALTRLEEALGKGPWLAGKSFTLADVAYAPFIERLVRLGFADLWRDKPTVADWARRIMARPAFAIAKCPDEFLMPGPGS
jgi:glutathione S-transferase